MTKTVFILGAGFSVPAKIPQQNKLLKMIFSAEISDMSWSTKIEKARPNIADFVLRFFSDKTYIDFLDAQDTSILDFLIDHYDYLADKNIYSFSGNDMEENLDYNKIIYEISSLNDERKLDVIELIIDAKKQDHGLFNKKIFTYIETTKDKVTLEDVFTILDKAIVSKEHFQLYDPSKLMILREDFIFCIIFLFNYYEEGESPIYQELANYLANERVSKEYEKNQFSIITLNWDMTIEKNIFSVVKKSYDKAFKKIRLDYCVYDNDYDIVFNDEKRDDIYSTPSTLLKAKGYKNIKIMKLHGSVNWLTCRKCQRLYYSFKSHLALESFKEDHFPVCPKCCVKKPFDKNSRTRIQADLITPTMIKDLNNVILRNIWENAFLDLSEADRLVFIGYSLPQADFEFRYLMKKSISSNVKIEVVLSTFDDPSLIDSKHSWIKTFLPEDRYRSFFPNDNIKFRYDGVEGFIKSLQ
ncbi:hypothetical protein HCJ04_09395 [Listeria welshimeri]|nr:hypothetical protein [Listeria welshimeri]